MTNLDNFLKNGGKITKLSRKSKKSNKIKKKKQRNSKKKILKQFSKQLNNDLSHSEKWFQNLYKSHKLDLNTDLYNKPFRVKYIPDVLNRSFRYVLEIDGSIHNTEKQKEIDKQKDIFYFKAGMLCIRIIAFNKDSYISGIEKLLAYRKTEETVEFKLFKNSI